MDSTFTLTRTKKIPVEVCQYVIEQAADNDTTYLNNVITANEM